MIVNIPMFDLGSKKNKTCFTTDKEPGSLVSNFPTLIIKSSFVTL
jgi:hypothetical protein